MLMLWLQAHARFTETGNVTTKSLWQVSAMAHANFMPGIKTKADAVAALDGCPARSYVTWRSDSRIFPHGIMLTYTNTIDRKQKTHMQLARSDLGVWMPESRSEHGIFTTVEHLLATRKYIDLAFHLPGSLSTVPPVPGMSVRCLMPLDGCPACKLSCTHDASSQQVAHFVGNAAIALNEIFHMESRLSTARAITSAWT